MVKKTSTCLTVTNKCFFMSLMYQEIDTMLILLHRFIDMFNLSFKTFALLILVLSAVLLSLIGVHVSITKEVFT